MSDAPKAGGRLFIVTTPIGNLGEITPRATDTLREVASVLCENTPKALRLLTHLGITGKSLKAIHDANEGRMAPAVAAEVAAGARLAYISEAGVPGISDPGFRLVRECRRLGLPVEVIGAPSALICALAGSGLPTDRFLFASFPPPKTVGRKKYFTELAASDHTFVFYESCHRILASMADLQEVVGPDRVVSLSAELTKLHESTQTAPISQLTLPKAPRGEWVVCVAKAGYTL